MVFIFWYRQQLSWFWGCEYSLDIIPQCSKFTISNHKPSRKVEEDAPKPFLKTPSICHVVQDHTPYEKQTSGRQNGLDRVRLGWVKGRKTCREKYRVKKKEDSRGWKIKRGWKKRQERRRRMLLLIQRAQFSFSAQWVKSYTSANHRPQPPPLLD